MTIQMSKEWPEMVVEPEMCSQFYIETVYIMNTIISCHHSVPGHSYGQFFIGQPGVS